MDFIEKLKELGRTIDQIKDDVATEEATKNAFVMPFITALGYNVFNPLEVVPEFNADHGVKTKEKVDYAIRKDGSIVMLIECKCCDAKLDVNHASQLYRYFGVTDAKIAILTNGIVYEVYTDLEKTNTMDRQPFLTFDLSDLNEALVPEIKRLSKSNFDLDETMNAAVTLKYTHGIRSIIEREFSEPSDEFVKHLAREVYPGKRMGSQQIEEFTPIVKRAIQQHISDKINARIAAALSDNSESTEKEAEPEETEQVEAEEPAIPDVETTEDEHQGFAVVKAILRKVIEPERIAMRDTKSYCGVLLDDNNRKPICRLHFNRDQKYIGLFDAEKNEDRVAIESVDDIYEYEGRLVETLEFYEEVVTGQAAEDVVTPQNRERDSDGVGNPIANTGGTVGGGENGSSGSTSAEE